MNKEKTQIADGVASVLNAELGFNINEKIETLYRIKGYNTLFASIDEAKQEILEKQIIKKGWEELRVFLDYIDKNCPIGILTGVIFKKDDFMDAYNNLKSVVERDKT